MITAVGVGMRGLTRWVKTHWILASLLLSVLFALVVFTSGTGGVGAGVAATIWVACATFLYALNRSQAADEKEQRDKQDAYEKEQRDRQAAHEKELRDMQAAYEQRLLENAGDVCDCLRELANQFDGLISVLQTTAPQDWDKKERADFSQRFVDFANQKRLIPRLRHSLAVLRTYRDTMDGERGNALEELITVGDSALGVVENRAHPYDGGNWEDFDMYLGTWSDLNDILQLLRKETDGIEQQKAVAADLSALAGELKRRAPGVYLAELAEAAYITLTTNLPQTWPGTSARLHSIPTE
jgi:hypothetical protein